MLYTIPHFVCGKKVDHSGRQLDIYHPATGKLAGSLHVADQTVIESAVAAANTAFLSWSQTPPAQRARSLSRFKLLLEENIDELARLVSTEHGKALHEAKGSVQRGIDVLEYACGIATHLTGDFSNEVTTGIDAYSLRQPVGVCVGITPFNFPAMIPLWMLSMAIACGNTFILKPSEKDPSCAVKLAELAQQAGIPDGVLNVVQGDKETVEALITHPQIQAVSFVGSSAVAEHVYKTAIAHNKRAQAFGGAKNHCVVMPDADLEQAATAIVMAAYGSSGERCMAISVVVAVGDDIAERLIDKMRPHIETFEVSPLVTKEHYERVRSYVSLGQAEGATLIIDKSNTNKPQAGFWMGACLFDHVTSSMRIYKEEIFGPVLCVMRVADVESAIALINAHAYGNGTAIFTSDGYTARLFAEKVHVGMVGINVPIPVPVAYHSFGGWKQSVFADIGMYGSEAIRFYTKLKTVTARWFAKES